MINCKEGCHCVVVEDSNKNIVAFGYIIGKTLNFDVEFTKGIDCKLDKLYVSPDVSRQGVGKLLYRELERRALEEGASGIGLLSSLYAVPFYEAHGFTVTRDAIFGVLEAKVMEKIRS